jgi:tetratricopeptide (TPR) repeat protein
MTTDLADITSLSVQEGAKRAVEVLKRGQRLGRAVLLFIVYGNAYLQLGETQRAIDYYEQCLMLHREIGDRQREARTLDNLGIAYAELGDSTCALPLAQEAARILGRIGSPYAQRAQQLVAQLQGRDSPGGL